MAAPTAISPTSPSPFTPSGLSGEGELLVQRPTDALDSRTTEADAFDTQCAVDELQITFGDLQHLAGQSLGLLDAGALVAEVVEELYVGCQRAGGIQQHRQRLGVNVHQLCRLRDVGILREYGHDGLIDVTNPVDGQHRVSEALKVRVDAVVANVLQRNGAKLGKILPGQHHLYCRMPTCFLNVHRGDRACA